MRKSLVTKVMVLALLSGSFMVACGGRSDSGCSSRSTITVLAASSLKSAFEDGIHAFAATHPCIDVRFSFGSSGALASQVVSGVPADVFVSAGKKATEQVVAAGLAKSGPVDFARNTLAIMVSTKSRYANSVEGLPDLLDSRHSGIKVGMCNPSAPCGTLADTVLGNAAIAYDLAALTRSEVADTEVESVEGLVTKVKLGELDAGLVYVSDCFSALKSTDVSCLTIPSEVDGHKVNDSTTYSVLGLSRNAGATAFTAFVQGTEFRSLLTNGYGFVGN